MLGLTAEPAEAHRLLPTSQMRKQGWEMLGIWTEVLGLLCRNHGSELSLGKTRTNPQDFVCVTSPGPVLLSISFYLWIITHR